MNKKTYTKQLFTACTNKKCLDGTEIYKDWNGTENKHKVSFDVPIGEFIGIKKGDMIPGLKCRRCKKETLIKD